MSEEEVKVNRKVYEALLESQSRLWRLEAAGVDNWDGYDYAMQADDEADPWA